MIEYLDENFNLHVIDGENEAVPESWILIPEGATHLLYSEINNKLKHFANNENKLMALYDIEDGCGHWYGDAAGYMYRGKADILWQRKDDSVVEAEVFEDDKVNQPSHYANFSIECIDAMQAMLSREEFIGYLRGNIFKYLWRYKLKNGVEDLKKAQWYQNKLIEVEENE